MTDLVILAGGKGTRIKKLIGNIPKPLAKFNKIKFLDYLLNFYCKFNINNIFIIAGYKGHLIYNKYHGITKNSVKINCIIEKYPMGTGGALKFIKKKLSNNFFVVNGDSLHDFDIFELFKIKRKNSHVISLCNIKKKIKSHKKFNNLKLKKNIVKFSDSAKNINISSGVYLFDKSIFKFFKKKIISLEDDIIFRLIKKEKIKGIVKKNNFFIDIGTPKDFKNTEKKLFQLFYKPAIFLDRDNTINIDKGYTHKIKNFKFKTKMLNFLKKVKKKYYLFIITNQAGIAHGIFKTKDLIKLQRYIKKVLYFDNKKTFIDDLRYCPFHPKAKLKKYRKTSLFRKPGNLMIEDLFKTWLINRKKSFFIGDHIKDKIAAMKSNIKFVWANEELNKKISIN